MSEATEDHGESDAPEKGLPAFNLFTWSMSIPLVDEDLWLGMQARNLAIVDMGAIREIETNVKATFFGDVVPI